MKNLIITQARFGSSRLPGKVLKKIDSRSLLEIHLSRLKKSQLADAIMVATTEEPEAAEIVGIAERCGCLSFRGSIHDVLDRFYQAAHPLKPAAIIRITSDCPLIDAAIIDDMLTVFNRGSADYLSNVHPPTFPDGMDVEIVKAEALKSAWEEATSAKDREHVTPFIWSQPGRFKLENFAGQKDFSSLRLTVDTPEDFQVVAHLVEQLGTEREWKEYAEYLSSHPEIRTMNGTQIRNSNF